MNGMELEQAIREKVYGLIGPETAGLENTLKPLLDQTLVRIIIRDLMPHADRLNARDIEALYEVHVHKTDGRNTLAHFAPDEAIEHVFDWMAWAVRTEADWLSRTDEHGKVRKLTKFGSVPAMIAEADKDISKSGQRTVIEVDARGTERIMDLADGYRIVRLVDPAALKAETSMMQHCVGMGGYDAAVTEGRTFIYSLRDGRGRSHATMNVSAKGRNVVELRGKQNRRPVDRYMRLMLQFFDREVFEWTRHSLASTGILVAEDNTHHLATEFPGHLCLRDLDLIALNSERETTPDIDLSALPRFTKNLAVENRNLACTRPEAVVFPGDVSIANSVFRPCTPRLEIAGKLHVRRVSFEKGSPELLLSRIYVGGTLVLEDIPGPIAIPIDLHTGGITARDCGLIFPDGYAVGGDVDISDNKLPYGREPGSRMHVLGSGMTVRGNLKISNSQFTELPPGLTVFGDLDISHTEITSLPDDLDLRGGLIARNSRLESLGKLKSIDGSADLNGSRVRMLPEGFEVAGSLDISVTSIGNLPPGLKLGGDLLMAGTPIAALPEKLRVPGKLDIRDTPLGRLPAGLDAGTLVITSAGPPPGREHDPWRVGPAISGPRQIAVWCPMLSGAAWSASVGKVMIGDICYPYKEIFVASILGRKLREPVVQASDDRVAAPA